MRRLILLLAIALPVSAATTDEWLADFRFLLNEISSHYANLDSAINDRRLDLPGMKKRAEDRIRAATDDAEAQRAIESFMNAFGDGHAYVRWVTSRQQSQSDDKPRPLCERLGYNSRDFGGVNFARLEDYKPIEDGDSTYFPGGILAGRFGVVRIHDFSETAHPAACAAALAALQVGDECDVECRMRLMFRSGDVLTAALERRLQALAKAGAKTIVIDLTRNGGGSDWVEPVARVISPVPLKAARMLFIRHPHWVKQLEERAADVRDDKKAAAVFDAAAAEARKTCDRSALWNDPPKKPDCSLLAPSTFYATGLLAYAKPGSLEGPAKSIYFNPSQYSYHEGTNRLPLIVLVDEGTASAAEYFAAMLQDNKAARIAGEGTRGSGCGHTNGGIFVNLPNSGARLALPDCVRLRADGSNEVLGVMPDVLIPWRTFDSAFQRAFKTKEALLGMMKAH